MTFTITDEQQMLRDSVRSYLSDKVPMERVRELMETETGFDDGLWQEMAQMGWQAMAIPEAYGGAGYSFYELGVLLEEMGRAVTPVPFFSSVVLGANAILLGGTDEQRSRLLPAIAAGDVRVTLALIDGGGWGPSDVTMEAAPSGDGYTLSGTKSYVIDGHTAHQLIVAARSPEGVDLFLVPADAAGVAAARHETIDMTRKQASVTFDGVGVAADQRLGSPGSGADVLHRLADMAVVALAFEQLGGAQACLEMSVDYAKERMQFGRPIGSFQAVKHKCAEMLIEVESARSAAHYAGRMIADGDDDAAVAAALAKAYCSEAFFHAAAETIQVHGGIGFTWEHDAHLYFKRAKTDLLLFGDPAEWRAKLAERVGI
ncbi:MAG: acyl-CoA dehydrogenase family protein [Acidimicrobiia bacterium]|nr:acyl-CoA dehydrogenase family protein [Acidimicrobiia bacterium]